MLSRAPDFPNPTAGEGVIYDRCGKVDDGLFTSVARDNYVFLDIFVPFALSSNRNTLLDRYVVKTGTV